MEQDVQGPEPLWKSNSQGITEVLLKVLDKVKNELVGVMSEESVFTKKSSATYYSENNVEKFNSVVEELGRVDSDFFIDLTTKDITEVLLDIVHEIKCDLMSNDTKEQLPSREGRSEITQSPGSTWNAKYFSSLQPTLAETKLQLDPTSTSMTATPLHEMELTLTTTSSCVPDKRPTQETCLVGQEITTLTPEGHKTELIETSENTTSTETKDILHHDVTPESSLLSPSTTHISENQFEIASSTTCVTLTPEEQKLTLSETNLQFHQDDKSVTATGERSVKETCLIGQETSTLTPEGDEAGLTETSEKIASGITCATLTSEEQKPTPAETNMEFNQSETSVTTPSSYITDKGSEKETCLFGQDTTTLTPVGHETELTKTGDKISSDTTCATLTPEEQKLTLAETNLQFDQSETSITTTSSCIPDKMPTEETCLVVQKTSTLTPEEHETELTETNENATPTETKDILHHDVTPESSLLSSSTTHISENQFEIASSTTCVTLTPEEQKLTLAETNLQFHLDDKSVTATSSCVLGERFVKETCLIGQETSTLTPEGHKAGLTETSEKIASGITCATLTSEEQTLTLAETNLQLDQSETSVTTTSSCISDKGSAKETCIVGQDTLTPEGHEMKLTETSENTTPTKTKDLLCHDVTPESPSTTHISGNQFEIASSTTCVTLTPEEQKLTLAETNLQFDQSET